MSVEKHDDDINGLFTDRSEKKGEGKYCVCNETKETHMVYTRNKPFVVRQITGFIH